MGQKNLECIADIDFLYVKFLDHYTCCQSWSNIDDFNKERTNQPVESVGYLIEEDDDFIYLASTVIYEDDAYTFTQVFGIIKSTIKEMKVITKGEDYEII